MDSSNMVMTKSKNNATRARITAFVTRSSKKFAGSKSGKSVGTTKNRAGSISRVDQEHQSVGGKNRGSTISSGDRG